MWQVTSGLWQVTSLGGFANGMANRLAADEPGCVITASNAMRRNIGAPLLGTSSLRVLGTLFIASGLPVLLDSFARFALQALGTPAPIFPTQYLVVSGLFRCMRNPMYVAVLSLIFGQGLGGSSPSVASASW